MYTLISGSNKNKKSNSTYFLTKIKEKLNIQNIYELKKDDYIDIIKNIENEEIIILAFPLYVDSPPSIVLELLDYIYDKKIDIKDKKIYTIINCGFKEGEQNLTAANIIKNWCKKTNSKYMGSLLIGSGEIIGNEKYKKLTTTAHKKLEEFINIITRKEETKDIIITMDYINSYLYCKFANISWNKKGKKNNLTIKDIKIK